MDAVEIAIIVKQNVMRKKTKKNNLKIKKSNAKDIDIMLKKLYTYIGMLVKYTNKKMRGGI